MNYQSAPVMGCNYAPVMGDSSASGQLQEAAALTKDLRNKAYSIAVKGPELFTTAAANEISDLYNRWKSAILALAQQYPDTDLSKINAGAAHIIASETPHIIKHIEEIQKYDPALGNAGAEIQAEIRAAIAAGNLDHPLIAPRVKKAYITGAYQSAGNPQSDIIIAKYNPDGTLKTGETIQPVTQAQALRNIELKFAEKGLTRQLPPDPLTAVPPTQAESSTQIPGGLIAAGIAGVIAFMALRG